MASRETTDPIHDLIPKFQRPNRGVATTSVARRDAARYSAHQRAAELEAWRAYAALRTKEANREAAEMIKIQKHEARMKRKATLASERASRNAASLERQQDEAALYIQGAFRGRHIRAKAKQQLAATWRSHEPSVWDGTVVSGESEAPDPLPRGGASIWDGDHSAASPVGARTVLSTWYDVPQLPKWQTATGWWHTTSDGRPPAARGGELNQNRGERMPATSLSSSHRLHTVAPRRVDVRDLQVPPSREARPTASPRGRAISPPARAAPHSFGSAARWPAESRQELVGPGRYSPRRRVDGRQI